MTERTARVVITCSGGLVRGVYADAPLKVHIVDWDEYERDEADSEIEADTEADAERIAAEITEQIGAIVKHKGDRVMIDRQQFPLYH